MSKVKAIELKSIVHNATKIGVQDGASEDLVNMRFKDGAWRPIGEPTAIGLDLGGVYYDYMYVHESNYTNIIAHSVSDNTLYWIASNNTNGVISDLKMLDERVVLLTNVFSDVSITQNGNLICVIDSNGTFDYFLFKQDSVEYVHLNNDTNGKNTDRVVFPFGDAHINLYSPNDKIREGAYQQNIVEDIDKGHVVWTHNDIGYNGENEIDAEVACNLVKAAFGIASERNLFTRPFLACLAVKMYDGSYLYATAPALIYPRQALTSGKKYSTGAGSTIVPNNCIVSYGMPYGKRQGDISSDEHLGLYAISYNKETKKATTLTIDQHYDDNIVMPTLCTSINNPFPLFPDKSEPYAFNTYVFGSDLVISINTDILKQNKDLFTHVAIFITPEVDVLDLTKDGCINNSVDLSPSYFLAAPIFFKNRDIDDIQNDLLNSSMYLLKEYSVEELASGDTSFIVDLQKAEDDGLLKNIALQKTLPIEAMSRTSYLPKCAYSYNGRLHIANYDSIQFHGYPADAFQKSNHSVKIVDSPIHPHLGLPYLELFNDSHLQGDKTRRLFIEQWQDDAEKNDYLDLAKSKGTCFAYIRTTIETIVGEQVVTRYIPPFDVDSVHFSKTWAEDLNAFISFPDIRAKKMEIRFFFYSPDDRQGAYYLKVFDLKPHKYLNFAYYIDDNLDSNYINKWESGTITKGDFSTDYINDIKPPKEKNIKESFLNGLKVSKTDNPLYFPVENTYLIGNDGIVAMCSNTIAVGSGQTGSAPLYVFCKDGIYALFVDASGQITYTNARALSREVCISERNVTPIDSGVVFVSNRGLMIMSGSEVENIGETIEGDVMQYSCTNPYYNDSCVCDNDAAAEYHSKDYNKIMSNAFHMKRICGFESYDSPQDDISSLWDRCDIGYDHINSELIVSFGNFSFIRDKYGNWTRRMFPIKTFVNQYPYTLIGNLDDLFYYAKCDGNNSIYALTNVIKLDSIGFKSISRLVARGYFETYPSIKNEYSVYGGEFVIKVFNTLYDASNNVNYLPNTPKKGDILYIYPNELNYPSMNIRITYKDGGTFDRTLSYGQPIDLFAKGYELESVKVRLNITADQEDSYEFSFKLERFVDNTVVGLYVFGSYDGRRWSCLGHKEKGGKFNDIGCIVSKTDCKFFRFLLAGRVTKNTRFDYFEVTEDNSRLSTKSR